MAEGIHVFSLHNSNNDVMQKLQQMQDLCATCGVTPANELNQQTLAALRTFGFGEDDPKKKLMVYLGMGKEWNAHALLSVTEESICRIGLNELAEEEIYQVKPGEAIDSSVLELAKVLDIKQPHLNMMQQGWRESIGTRITHDCEDAKLDFQLDKKVDKKSFKRG